jgi:hypothetical protein
MLNSRVMQNQANVGGGIVSFGVAVLSGCTICSNVCGYIPGGGGVANSGYLNMYNCTLSQNSASGPAPAAAAFTDQTPSGGNVFGTTYLDHCTVVSNSGPYYEIGVSTNFNAANSILADCHGTVISGGHNLIMKTNGTAILGDETGNLYQINPLLGPLQNNGGPTPTHALLPGSPAIDHADAGSVTTDQRGATRPPGPSASDIGAYEVVSVTPPNLQISISGPQVRLYWPSAPGPALLQQNAGLIGAGWSDVGTYPTDDGTTTSLLLPANVAQGFFRLRSP